MHIRPLIKWLAFLMVLALLPLSLAEEEIPPLETPAPARIHESPEPIPELPVIVNHSLPDDPWADIKFRSDSVFLHIWFPNIMNADEAILLCEDEVWLIDCGDERSAARGVELMNKLGITKIDKLFNTHPHYDHLRGLEVTHTSVPVKELLICFPEDACETMINAVAYAKEHAIPIRQYNDGEIFTMAGRVSLKFFFNDDESLDMNNNSAQTLLQYGDRRMLFMADMDRPGQQVMLTRRSAEELRAEVIKYPHHGKTGLLDEFYQAVRPQLAVITNSYVKWGGIEYLIWKQIPRFYTNPTEKYVHLYTDGKTWVAEYVPMNFK